MVLHPKSCLGAAALSSLLLAAPGAGAQSAGTYLGVTTDGHPVQVDVFQDAATGALYVADIFSGFGLRCRRAGTVQEWNLGLLGFVSDISAGQAAFDYFSANFYMTGSMTFTGATTLEGTVQGALPLFVDAGSPPRSAESCRSLTLGFTATLAPAPVAPRAGAGAQRSEGVLRGRPVQTLAVPGRS